MVDACARGVLYVSVSRLYNHHLHLEARWILYLTGLFAFFHTTNLSI